MADCLNILLVDDNDVDIKIEIRAFKNATFKNNLFIANGGQAVFDFFGQPKNPRPDLILLDISMPGMDGFEVLQKIKGDQMICNIPVIMLSASKNEQDIARSYNLGASNFIQKPVSYEEFIEVVEGFSIYWKKGLHP